MKRSRKLVWTKRKIAIARYGNSFRGVKARVAEQNGALGLLIYSDPADDGYMQGDVYPKGPGVLRLQRKEARCSTCFSILVIL